MRPQLTLFLRLSFTDILFTGKASFVGVAISRPILLSSTKISLSGTFVHKNLKKPAYLEANLPSEDKCGRFLRCDLLNVLNGFMDTGNEIVDNFRTHLQRREDATNSWTDVTYSSWSSHAIEGFYTALEESWRKKHNDWSDWGYVPNPSGGFLGWFGGSERIGTEERHLAIYLQIDNGTRLAVRLGSGNAVERVRKQLMYEALREVDRVCIESPDDIRCEKAGRFRGGKSADVAKLTFGGKDPWFAVDADGMVDVDAAVDRLCHVRELLRRIPGDLTERGLIENG